MSSDITAAPVHIHSSDAYHTWAMFGDAIRLAISSRMLLLGLSGMFMASLAWKLSGFLFLPVERPIEIAAFHARAAAWPATASAPEGLFQFGRTFAARISGSEGPSAPTTAMSSRGRLLPPRFIPIDPVFGVPWRMVEPFRRLLCPSPSWRVTVYFLVGSACTLSIWAFVGGAIVRAAVVSFGLRERVGLRDSLWYSARTWRAVFAAPLLPMTALAAFALPLIMLGWLTRLDIGVFVAGIVWGLVCVDALLMALLAWGLSLGWPLMWGAIVAEHSDAFDAVSRAYAYTFQKPFHYFGYALMAAGMGTLGWLLAWAFSESVVALGSSAVEWGSGSLRMLEIQQAQFGSANDATFGSSFGLGARFIGIVSGLVRSAASAYSFSYFWCVAGALYLSLRRDTDQTPTDHVAHEGGDEDSSAELPPLEADRHGVPGVETDAGSAACTNR